MSHFRSWEMVVPRNLNDSTAVTVLFMMVSGGRAGGFLLKSTIISTVLSVLSSPRTYTKCVDAALHSRSHPLYRLARQILLWAQGKLLSLRAVYIPGYLNQGADILSRQGLRPGGWRLHPEVVELLWREFGQAEVDLFASQEMTHCPLWFSLTHPAPLGLDAMVQTWPRLRLYAFPLIVLLPGVLERVCRDGVRLLLVALFWPARVWYSDLVSLPDGSPLEIPIRRFQSSLRRGAPFFTPTRSCGNCGHGP